MFVGLQVSNGSFPRFNIRYIIRTGLTLLQRGIGTEQWTQWRAEQQLSIVAFERRHLSRSDRHKRLRNFYRFADPSTLLKLYTSLVRPHTEYACAIWDPQLSNNFLAIEGTQNFALRVCLKNWSADYDLLLNLAQLPRLSSRREIFKLCLLFNIFTGKIAYHDSPLERRLSPSPNRLQNSLQLSPLYARTDHFKYSFFPSSIEAWNSLHFDVASKNSLLSFKRALHNVLL